MLPPGYDHILCEVDEGKRVRLKVKVSKEQEVEGWMRAFQESSKITWRKARTYPGSGKYNTSKVSVAWKCRIQRQY